MKQIDVSGASHTINGKPELPHTHLGYYHKEKGTRTLTPKEKRMVARVLNVWQNYMK